MDEVKLTKDEAYAISEFIDMNIFQAIRSDDEWDSVCALRNLIHGYEKCCAFGGYVGVTEPMDGGERESEIHSDI